MAILTARETSSSVRAILFDKDGTLLDFTFTWGYWSERLLARFSAGLAVRGRQPLPQPFPGLFGTLHAADGATTGYDRGGPLAMATPDELLAVLAWHGYRAGLPWAEAAALARECRLHVDRELDEARLVRPLPHVVPLLEQCRESGAALAVVTADETGAAVKHLEWLGIRQYFAAVVGSDRVERAKPFPDMAEAACRELGVPCSQAAIVGDTNGDMRMAKAAGAALAVAIASADADAAGLPDADVVIASYAELRVRRDEQGGAR